jgi:hypothetical protein
LGGYHQGIRHLRLKIGDVPDFDSAHMTRSSTVDLHGMTRIMTAILRRNLICAYP